MDRSLYKVDRNLYEVDRSLYEVDRSLYRVKIRYSRYDSGKNVLLVIDPLSW